MNLNEISYRIRGAVFDVYNELGPGLLEKVYEQALIIELQNKELQVQNQVPIEVLYKGLDLGLILYLSLSLIHIFEPTRLLSISYAVFCLKKKNIKELL